jgi:2-keto-4-pentenoate hydratase/2-oxohepta-3-ene-1,7-dioic acid hydratase in catechol pathway
MQLLRVGSLGAERPAVRADDGDLFDLTPLTDDIDGACLSTDGVARAREALAAGTLPRLDGDGDGLRIGAPVARPGAVVCIGQNYAAHAAESGSQPPIVFLKHPNTVVGPYDEAAACVAGYLIANDVSERDFQKLESGGQWSKGKCAETFSPLGPWLVPADEVADPQDLRLRSWVNGEPRQDSSTADMIFGVHELILHLSQYMVLDPGDALDTGTPEGVAMSGRYPFLAPGDVVEMEITGLGRQGTTLTAAP